MSNEFKGVSLEQAIRAATAARPLRPAPEARPTSPVNGGRIAVPRMLSIPPPFMGEVSSGEAARRRGCEVTENSRIPATFENGQNRPFGATGQGIGRLEVFCFFRKETEWAFLRNEEGGTFFPVLSCHSGNREAIIRNPVRRRRRLRRPRRSSRGQARVCRAHQAKGEAPLRP